MEVNQEKRAKFMENAGKRVNKVMHDIEILEPMSRSSVYDFTKEDVEEMFDAMQNALDTAKEQYNKKFEGRAKSERKLFSFGTGITQNNNTQTNNTATYTQTPVEEEAVINTAQNTAEDIELNALEETL
ncbi:MAG: hypothetical protein HFJ28_00755 [Clostridia bacterium]|jgi:hypothetical protein|nr:hypothetical protein [Clostridia bacterium]